MITYSRCVEIFLLIAVATTGAALELVRYDLQKNEEVSSDLGSYQLFTCTGVGDDRSCTTDMEELRPYMSGIATYGAANMAALVLMILFILFWILMKIIMMFVWCCKKCCCRGKVDPNLENQGPKMVEDPDAYTKTDKYRIACFAAAILGITIVFTLSTLLGNYKVTENSSGFVDAPVGFQLIIEGMATPASNAILSTFSLILAPMLVSINSTFSQAISLPDIIEQLQILNDSRPLLPSDDIIYAAMYDSADATTTGAVPYFNALYGNVSEIDAIVVSSQEYVEILAVDVNTTTHATSRLLAATTTLNSTLYDFNDLMVELVGSSDGTGGSGSFQVARDDLTAIQRQPTGLVPTTTEFDATMTGGSGTLPRLKDGSMENQVNEIEQLAARLHWLYLNMSELPDYATVADDLDALNATITSVLDPERGLITNMTNALSGLNANIDAFPSLTNVSDHLTGLQDTVNQLDFSNIINTLDALVDSIFDPITHNVALVYNETEKLYNVVDIVVPALKVLRAQVDSINATLVEMRSQDIIDALEDFDEKCNVTWAYEQVDDVLKIVRDAQANISDYREDADDYLAEAFNFSSSIQDAIASNNFTDILNSLNDAQSFIDDVNTSSTVGSTDAFRDSLADVSIPKGLTDSLRDFQTTVSAMKFKLARVAANASSDYYQLALGVCVGTPTQSCTDDSDCTGTCVFGKYRCSVSGAACTADSDCASGNDCLADTDTATALEGYMTSFSSTASDVYVPSSMTDAMEESESLSDVNLDEAISGIEDVTSALDSFNMTDINEYLVQINESVVINVTSTIGDPLRDLQQMMIDLELRDLVEKYDYSNFTWERYLLEYTDSFTAIKDFMVDDRYLADAVRNLSTSKLHGIRDTQGHSAAIRYAAAQIDWFSVYFHENVKFGSLTIKESDLEGDVGNTFDFLDKMSGCSSCGYSDMTSNGATYYLMRLFGEDTVRADYAKLMGFVVNSDYERYEDNNYCVTTKCEDHSMAVLNEQPMSDWDAEFPGMGLDIFASVGYTREEFNIYIWLFPMFTVFVSIIVVYYNFRNHKAPRMRKCCTSLMMSCTVCQLFFILLFTALIFPMAVMFQDVCDSGANIGSNYIITYGDDMCANMFGGRGTLRECSISSRNTSFNLDILGMYDGLFKQQCGSNDPFKSILYDIADEVYDIPEKELNKTLDDMEGDFVLRPSLKNIFIQASDNSGQLMGNFFTDVGDNSLNCANLAMIVGGLKGATCDSYVEPGLWVVGTWYLCAWMLLCCMFPAGCCRKNYNMKEEEVEERVDDQGRLVKSPRRGVGDEGEEGGSWGQQKQPGSNEVHEFVEDESGDVEMRGAHFENPNRGAATAPKETNLARVHVENESFAAPHDASNFGEEKDDGNVF